MGKNNTDYDVIIIGGGTAGCSCAWNCSRLGLKTLLIEKNNYLGGAITSQLVIPSMNTEHKNYNTDFFNKLCVEANKNHAQITYGDGNKGWLNPFKLPEILYFMLCDVNCDVMLNSTVYDYRFKKNIDTNDTNNIHQDQKIISLYIETKYTNNNKGVSYIDAKHSNNVCNENFSKNNFLNAKYFIDATGDANFSELVKADFLPYKNNQAMSLRFVMSNVDKKAFSEWILQLDSDRNVTTVYEIDDDIHLSTACTWDLGSKWALKPLFDDAVRKNILKDSDRAYFQIFSIAGENDKIAFNCPRIITDRILNPLNQNDINEAKNIAIEAIARLKNFCNLYLKGFENAQIYKIANELGVRESRRVKGKYVLTKEDIFNATEFKNPVAYSNYPIDIHSIKKDNSILNYVQKVYSVPLESLMVEGFENLYVIGRCLSADFYAQAALRIQPTCFSMGEGLAKYLRLL